MELADVRTLFEYDRWANERLLDSVTGLSEEQYVKDLGSSHGGVHGTLAHIYAADRIWLDRWLGRNPTSLVTAEQIGSLDRLRSLWATLQEELSRLLEALTEERLQAPLKYRDTRGNDYEQPLVQQMQHRVNHSTYHRGQLVTFLRQLGAKPESTDLIQFYRERGK